MTEIVTLHVNGTDYTLALDTRTTLLDALRDHLGLKGSQEGLRRGRVRRLHRAHGRATPSSPAPTSPWTPRATT